VIWAIVSPLAGLAALASLVVALGLSALGFWPTAAHVNLPVLALLIVGGIMPLAVAAGRAVERIAASARWAAVDRSVAVVIAVGVPMTLAAEARSAFLELPDVSQLLRQTARSVRRADVVLLDRTARVNVEAGVVSFSGEWRSGPRLWTSADQVVAFANAAPPARRLFVPLTLLPFRVEGLEARTDAAGRVFRKAWEGRATALYVAEVHAP
jgi:hypothetical protein